MRGLNYDMSRFTDINVPYSVDPDDNRTDEEVLKDMGKI